MAYENNEQQSYSPEMAKSIFDSLGTDKEKWTWVLNNKDKMELSVTLDNDNTLLIFGEDEEEGEHIYSAFNDYLGHSYGVSELLSALGIESQGA